MRDAGVPAGAHSCICERREVFQMVQLVHECIVVPARDVPNHLSVPFAYPPLPRLDVPPHTPDAHTHPSQSRRASGTRTMHGGSRLARATSTIMTGRASDKGPLSSHTALLTAGRCRRAGGRPVASGALFLRRAPKSNCITLAYHLQRPWMSRRGPGCRLFGSDGPP